MCKNNDVFYKNAFRMPQNALFYKKMSKKGTKIWILFDFLRIFANESNTVSGNTLNLLTLNFIIK